MTINGIPKLGVDKILEIDTTRLAEMSNNSIIMRVLVLNNGNSGYPTSLKDVFWCVLL